MRVWLSWIGAVFSAVVAPGLGMAEDPKPDPFAEDLLRYRSYFDYGGFQPDLGTVLPTGYRNDWSARAGLSGTYSDNWDKAAERDGAAWADAILGLGWVHRSPRLEGSLDYRYATPFYESEDLEGRDTTTQEAAGGVRWRATERLTLAASGSLAQNLETSLASPVPGGRSSYSDRSDQYRAQANGAWRTGQDRSATADYSFAYRDYRSDRAEGEDTIAHRGGVSAQFQVAPRDVVETEARYEHEDVLSDPVRRDGGRLDLRWTHALDSVSGSRRGSFLTSYAGEREESATETDWWSHTARLGYRQVFSPRISAGADAGYQWVLPDAGGDGGGWVAGVNATYLLGEHTRGDASASRSHQYLPKEGRTDSVFGLNVGVDHAFSAYTTGKVSVSHSYARRPASADTEYTVLTKTWLAAASLTSRLSESWRADVSAAWEVGSRGESAGPAADGGDYWQASGQAALNGAAGRGNFAGALLQVTRRQTDESDDDYLLALTRVLFRRDFLDWLQGEVSYAHERRSYDASSRLESYRENRGVVTVTMTW